MVGIGFSVYEYTGVATFNTSWLGLDRTPPTAIQSRINYLARYQTMEGWNGSIYN